MQEAPLPVEFVTGLPATIAPSISQLIEMFPPMKPIKLSDKCIAQLEELTSIVKTLEKYDGLSSDMLSSVLELGDTVQDVFSNPKLATLDMTTFDAALRVKRNMGGVGMEKHLLMELMSKCFARNKWRIVSLDLLSKYPDARFDVTDYVNLVHNKHTNEIMVYSYSLPGYRFKSARNVVRYNKLGEVMSSDENPDEDEATAWAKLQDDE